MSRYPDITVVWIELWTGTFRRRGQFCMHLNAVSSPVAESPRSCIGRFKRQYLDIRMSEIRISSGRQNTYWIKTFSVFTRIQTSGCIIRCIIAMYRRNTLMLWTTVYEVVMDGLLTCFMTNVKRYGVGRLRRNKFLLELSRRKYALSKSTLKIPTVSQLMMSPMSLGLPLQSHHHQGHQHQPHPLPPSTVKT